jgi:hypothetical protein
MITFDQKEDDRTLRGQNLLSALHLKFYTISDNNSLYNLKKR